jgi:uncharacterized protein
MQHLTLILKPTHLCNGACVYCSAWKEAYQTPNMSRQTLARLVERLAEYGEQEAVQSIRFTWHGGEPLLMPTDFYHQALRLQKDLLKPLGIKVHNSMQSNLLALDKQKARMLVKLLDGETEGKGVIGSSVEVLPGIRAARHGDYQEQLQRSLKLAKEFGLRYGFVYTTHRRALGRAARIYQAVQERYQPVSVRFNPMYPEGRARSDSMHDLHLTPRQWGEFLLELREYHLAAGRALNLLPLDSWEAYHQRGEFNLACEESGNCTANHLGVDTGGTIYSCGRGVDRASTPFGNIHSQSLGEILNAPQRIGMHNRRLYLRETHCAGCPWWGYCHGGCPIDAELAGGDIFQPTSWCEGRRLYFEKAFGQARSQTIAAG